MGAEVFLALEDGDVQFAEATLKSLEDKAPKSRYTVMARAQVFEKQGEEKMARVNFALACINGHPLACKKAPGAKKAGGE